MKSGRATTSTVPYYIKRGLFVNGIVRVEVTACSIWKRPATKGLCGGGEVLWAGSEQIKATSPGWEL
jgi:hypothetical protein